MRTELPNKVGCETRTTPEAIAERTHAVYRAQLEDKAVKSRLPLFMPYDRRYLLVREEKAIAMPLARTALDLVALHRAECPMPLLRMAPLELNRVLDDLERGKPRQSLQDLERVEQMADAREDVSQVETLVQAIPTEFAIRERIKQLKASIAAQSELVRAYEWELADRAQLHATAVRRSHAQ